MTSERIPPVIDTLTAWSWRLLVIGAAGVAALIALSRLQLVLIPLAIAFLLATALVPPVRWLVSRGVPPAIGTWIVLLVFLTAVVGIGRAIVTPIVAETDGLDETLEDGADRIEDWLVDGPLGIDRTRVEDARERTAESIETAITADGQLLSGALVVAQALAGLVLTLVITFFLVKDGPELQRWATGLLPEARQEQGRAMAGAAWTTLGRYLVGGASLGLVEAVIMGITLTVVGADVVLPVVALTFAAAFVPFVGAIVAGTVATLVTLASSGPTAALVVAGIALLVQQFDNDLLAPLIYSRALRLHPLAVILALATGAAIGGLVGAVAAVPTVAVARHAYAAGREKTPL